MTFERRRRSVGQGFVQAGYRAAKEWTFEKPTPWDEAEGNSGCIASARCSRSRAVIDPAHARKDILFENREVPWYRLRQMERQAVSGKSKTYADDERAWEVGQFGSTAEVSEQSRPRGGDGGGGGKGTGQGEPTAAKRAPDTEPERRAQCAGAGT